MSNLNPLCWNWSQSLLCSLSAEMNLALCGCPSLFSGKPPSHPHWMYTGHCEGGAVEPTFHDLEEVPAKSFGSLCLLSVLTTTTYFFEYLAATWQETSQSGLLGLSLIESQLLLPGQALLLKCAAGCACAPHTDLFYAGKQERRSGVMRGRRGQKRNGGFLVFLGNTKWYFQIHTISEINYSGIMYLFFSIDSHQ